MNAEKLHAICLVLQDEINKIGIHKKLELAVNHLQQIVAQPNTPKPQEQLSNLLASLHNELSNSKISTFSPAWKDVLDEIGAGDLLGISLSERIKTIVESNNVTPTTAQNEVQRISQEVNNLKNSIDQTISGLSSLHIGHEELEPGECEIGVVIPREAINNKLLDFGSELKEINFIFSIFSEIASDESENFEIKSISSTELSVILAAIPPVAACITYAVKNIIDSYKSVVEIRKLKSELKIHGIKEKQLKGITDHTDNIMSKNIDQLSVEIVTNYYDGKDVERKNELINGSRISLNKLANRIDQGFNFEIRAEPLEQIEDEDDDSSVKDINQGHIDTIINAAESLKYLNLEGERILSLPENGDLKEKSSK